MILVPSFLENDSKPAYEQTDLNKPYGPDPEVSGRQADSSYALACALLCRRTVAGSDSLHLTDLVYTG